MGADIEELEDGFVVRGPRPLRAAACDALGDHRLAMTFLVAGLIADGPVRVLRAENIGDSFPGFLAMLGGEV
jgi:3-phosphoshikimate 1-carboxyvinyltransferase